MNENDSSQYQYALVASELERERERVRELEREQELELEQEREQELELEREQEQEQEREQEREQEQERERELEQEQERERELMKTIYLIPLLASLSYGACDKGCEPYAPGLCACNQPTDQATFLIKPAYSDEKPPKEKQASWMRERIHVDDAVLAKDGTGYVMPDPSGVRLDPQNPKP